jgi:hypothetical protein
MNNSIPPVINDFVKHDKPNEIEGYNHLAYIDWIDKKEHLASDWTVIAKTDRTKDDQDFNTISCFATPPTDETKKILFTRATWEISGEFGIPQIEGGLDDEWEFQEHPKYQIEHLTLKPIVISRNFHSYLPSRFEIIQHILLYYEAFWVEDKKEFQTIEENGDIITVIKHIRNSDVDEVVYINTKYLRNYLALTNSFLVRFHDHRRKFKNAMPFKTKDASFNNDVCSYRIEVYNENFVKGYLSYSRLLGKDIIKPFEKPTSRFTFDTPEKDYVEFIYGINENGENLQYTCNEHYLSNYFTDTGAPHFLSAVYFNKSVLLKYYSEPSRFTVTSRHISCLSLWSIDIDITNEDLVQVWLGDLGRLPQNEQLHWKHYNVQPRGTISKYRFETDFEAKFSAPAVEKTPVAYLIRAYNELNHLTAKQFAGKVFLELEKNDDHYLKIVREPLTEEWKEFDEQIQALAKIFCDSINVKLLESVSGRKIDNKEIKGSISLLYVSLEKLGLSTEKINITIEALQAIQTIRSTGAAHRKGKSFEQNLEKYKLNNLTNENKIKQLTIKLYYGLQSIIDYLQNEKSE